MITNKLEENKTRLHLNHEQECTSTCISMKTLQFTIDVFVLDGVELLSYAPVLRDSVSTKMASLPISLYLRLIVQVRLN